MAAKKAAKKGRKKKTAARRTNATGVTVRMFCHGLGDCFLVSIPQEGTRPYAILIDCGIAMGTPHETNLMRQVIKEIAYLTKDTASGTSIIDLLVVTHQHRDHVSGFVQGEQELARIEFKKVWFAWTENRRDELANELRVKHAKEKAALERAFVIAQALAPASPSGKRLFRSLRGVLAFYESVPAAGGGQVDVAGAMAAAGKLCKSTDPSTLMPGEILHLPDASGGMAEGVRAFVLGPPHDGPKLRRINPRKKEPETYEKGAPMGASLTSLGMSPALAAAMSGHAAALGIGSDENERAEAESAMPFDGKWRRDLKSLEKSKSKEEFFRKNYFAVDPERQIDADWLRSGAERIALYMESYTNNTSLALAFQLPKSRKVLLFAADAQVGSWLSWHDVEYQTSDDRPVRAADLLANTVLYKVGHHGSHNATLREKGLELMTHPELVAMLPVEKAAVDRLGYGEMPLVSLLRELEKRTEGRVLQLDKKWAGGKPPGTWRPGMIKAWLARGAFNEGAEGRAIYMAHSVLDIPRYARR